MHIKIKKGLDVPLAGSPEQTISAGPDVTSVALLGPDTHDLKPRMLVREGEHVRLGQPLYTDKANPGINFTSPGSGTVTRINRGERRILQSVVIELDGDDAEEYPHVSPGELADLDADTVRETLLASGLWTAFRTRPFSKVPAAESSPRAIFVTAIDTNPLAPDPGVVIKDDPDAFRLGLALVQKLVHGPVYICTADNANIEVPNDLPFRHAVFQGPHPAGLPGTHIHFLEPVSESKVVWHIGYQDVIAMARLFTTGRLPVERVIAIGGPMIETPRLVRTRLGANTGELVRSSLRPGDVRVVSGSVLSGHRAAGWASYLGRYHS